MRSHCENVQINSMFIEYKIVKDEIKKNIKRSIHASTKGISKGIDIYKTSKRFVKPIDN